MNLLDEVVAALYDPVLRASESAGLGAMRRRLLQGVQGNVVEIGAGTGANLEHYGRRVERLTLLEPSPPMLARLRHRIAADPPRARAEVIRASAEALPVGDAQVDTVVSTLVLCSVTDLALGLREIRRVLREDGTLVLIEHVAAEGRRATAQRLLAPTWKVAARGCDLTRETVAELDRAGFDVSGIVSWRLPHGGPAAPAIVGTARPR